MPEEETKLNIAMIGLKGIPAKWGGMEKYVEEVGKRLVQKGHDVTVFGSKWYCSDHQEKSHLGMKVQAVPTIHLQSTDALSNALLSSLLISLGNYNLVHFHGYASYYFIPFVKLCGKKTVLTAHGFESGWDNPKYSSTARTIIENAFKTGIRHADIVTTVASHLKTSIGETFNVESFITPSGIEQQPQLPPEIIKQKYRLNGRDYLLFLGRIDPIKRVDWLLDLPAILGQNTKIVIAGGAQDSTTQLYLRELKNKASCIPTIIFTGPVQGQEKYELLSNCLAFITPSRNEGLPITLLEALSMGKCGIASDIAAHREVIQDGISGFLFDSSIKEDFLSVVKNMLALSDDRISSIGEVARQSVTKIYNWERTTDLFEKIYSDAITSKKG